VIKHLLAGNHWLRWTDKENHNSMAGFLSTSIGGVKSMGTPMDANYDCQTHMAKKTIWLFNIAMENRHFQWEDPL